MAISDFFNNKPTPKSDLNDLDENIITREENISISEAKVIPPEIDTIMPPESSESALFTSKEEKTPEVMPKSGRPSFNVKALEHIGNDSLIESTEIDTQLEKINGRFNNAIEELVKELKKEVSLLDDKIEQQKIQIQTAEEESARIKERIESLEAA